MGIDDVVSGAEEAMDGEASHGGGVGVSRMPIGAHELLAGGLSSLACLGAHSQDRLGRRKLKAAKDDATAAASLWPHDRIGARLLDLDYRPDPTAAYWTWDMELRTVDHRRYDIPEAAADMVARHPPRA